MNFVLDKGYKATTAITQFRFVTLTADDSVKQADAAGQQALGVCMETISAADATAGRIADIRLMGIVRAINGTAGALARNAKLKVDSQGRVVITAAATDICVGIALTACTAQGDQLEVLLTPGAIGQ